MRYSKERRDKSQCRLRRLTLESLEHRLMLATLTLSSVPTYESLGEGQWNRTLENDGAAIRTSASFNTSPDGIFRIAGPRWGFQTSWDTTVTVEPSEPDEKAGDPIGVFASFRASAASPIAGSGDSPFKSKVFEVRASIDGQDIFNETRSGLFDSENFVADVVTKLKIGDSFVVSWFMKGEAVTSEEFIGTQAGWLGWDLFNLTGEISATISTGTGVDLAVTQETDTSKPITWNDASDGGGFTFSYDVVNVSQEPIEDFYVDFHWATGHLPTQKSSLAYELLVTDRTTDQNIKIISGGQDLKSEGQHVIHVPYEAMAQFGNPNPLLYLQLELDSGDGIYEIFERNNYYAAKVLPMSVNVVTHGWKPPGTSVELFREPWRKIGETLADLPGDESMFTGRSLSYATEWNSTSSTLGVPLFTVGFSAMMASKLFDAGVAVDPLLAPIFLPLYLISVNIAEMTAEKADRDVVLGAKKALTDVFESYLEPDPQIANEFQHITLLGHSRGAALNSELARLLWKKGYRNIEYIALDGYDTDWPSGGGALSNISIEGNLAALTSNGVLAINARAQEGLERDPEILDVIDGFANFWGLFPSSLRQVLWERHTGIDSLRAPPRPSFGSNFDMPRAPNMEVPGDATHHTTITDAFVKGNYLELTYIGNEVRKLRDSNGQKEGGEGESLFSDNSSATNHWPGIDLNTPPIVFDGDFEKIGQLCSMARDIESFESGIAELDMLFSDDSCHELFNLFWTTEGDTLLYIDGDNSHVSLRPEGDQPAWLEQEVVLPDGRSYLELDFASSVEDSGRWMYIEINGERVHQEAWPGTSARQIRIPLSEADVAAKIRFVVEGSSEGDAHVLLDNIQITPVPENPADLAIVQRAFPTVPLHLPLGNAIGMTIAELMDHDTPMGKDPLRGVAIQTPRSDAGEIQYSVDSGRTWRTLSTPPGYALLLANDGYSQIRYLPREVSGCQPDLVALQGWSANEWPNAITGELVRIAEGESITATSTQFLSAGVVDNLSAWRNWQDPLDTNRNGSVSALDALIVINELNRLAPTDSTGRLATNPAQVESFVDVNGDGFVSAIDALVIINALNGNERSASYQPWSPEAIDVTCPSLTALTLGEVAIEREDVSAGPTQIHLSFSKSLDRQTLNAETISVRDDSGQLVPIETVTWDDSGQNATIETPILSADRYYLELDAGHVRDLSANPLGSGVRRYAISGGFSLMHDLAGYWPFDGADWALNQVNNQSGIVLDGSQTDGGKVGKAFTLDGIDDAIEITQPLHLSAQDGFSVSLWFQANPDQESTDGLVALLDHSHGFARGNTGWVIQASATTGHVSFGIGDGTKFVVAESATNLADGEFHHFTSVVADDAIRLYIDGKFELSVPNYSTPMFADGSLFVGRVSGDVYTTRSFRGTIDEVALWNRDLTDNEVADLYNDGAGLSLPDLTRPWVVRADTESHQRIADSWVPNRILLEFNEPIRLTEENFLELTLKDLSGETIPIQSVSLSTNQKELRILVPLLTDAQYQLHASGIGIEDLEGNPMGPMVFDVSAAMPITSLLENLQEYWAFDSANPADSSVGASNGQLEGAVQAVPGHLGDGLLFDGVDDGVVFPNNPQWSDASDFTLSLWFRADVSQPSEMFALLDQSHGFQHGFVGLAIQGIAGSNQIVFGVGDGTAFPHMTLERNILDEEFHHLVMIVTSVEMKAYLNGERLASHTFQRPPLLNDSGDLYLGRVLGDGQTFRRFRGMIDDVGIWNRALNELEVDALFSDGVGMDLRDLMQ